MAVENKPLVTVVMPAYCAASYIEQAIDSVYEQDVPLELIVIDDCSKDETAEILRKYQNRDDFIYLCNDRNEGAAHSRNRGVELAKGEYVAFLDSDDWWDKGKLQSQLKAIEKTGYVMCSTARELVHADGTATGRVIGVKETVTYKELLKHNSINCSSVLIRKNVAKEFPMCYDQSHEDYITWLKILRKYGNCVGINTPYLKCRLSEGGKSRNKIKSAKMTFAVYRYMGYSMVQSIRYFCSYAIHGVLKYYVGKGKS